MQHAQRRREPTAKMLDYAIDVARKRGVPLPPGCYHDFDACAEFLDGPTAPGAPSRKQLDYARDIARNTGESIPNWALRHWKELSKWINETKRRHGMPTGHRAGVRRHYERV